MQFFSEKEAELLDSFPISKQQGWMMMVILVMKAVVQYLKHSSVLYILDIDK